MVFGFYILAFSLLILCVRRQLQGASSRLPSGGSQGLNSAGGWACFLTLPSQYTERGRCVTSGLVQKSRSLSHFKSPETRPHVPVLTFGLFLPWWLRPLSTYRSGEEHKGAHCNPPKTPTSLSQCSTFECHRDREEQSMVPHGFFEDFLFLSCDDS